MCRTSACGAAATTFDVPLLAGEHVTEDTGTGFVHTAPGHGTETSRSGRKIAPLLEARGIDTTIPFTVDEAGYFTKDAPGFEGKRVIDDKGKFGDANFAVIAALTEAACADRALALQARLPAFLALQEAGDLPRHAAMVHRHGQAHRGHRARLRTRALKAIDDTRWVPPQGENRITGMIETQARLGGVAPARLGRADHRVPPQGDRRGDPAPRLRRLD